LRNWAKSQAWASVKTTLISTVFIMFSGGWGARPLLPPIHRRTQHGLSSPVALSLGVCKAPAAGGPVAAADAAGGGFALGEPLGAAGRCAARRARHAQRRVGGGQRLRRSRTFQRACGLLLSVALDQLARSVIPCWIRSHAAGGHLNIAQIMRGGSPNTRPAAECA